MAYPGNPELSAQAQERVRTAFRQVVAKLQDGQREEAMIGLEFVLRLDPTFRPALNLQQQLASGASEIDLSGIISDLQAPTTDNINLLLIEAVEAFEARDFQAARHKVDTILKDLPGHKDARHLLAQIEDALKVETQVEQFLGQAQEALADGDPQEAANFVMMAQALDPHHGGISEALATIRAAGGLAAAQPTPTHEAAPAPTDSDAVPTFGGPDDGDIQFNTIHDSAPSFEEPAARPDFGTGEFEAPSADDFPAFGDTAHPFGGDDADGGPTWQGVEPVAAAPDDDRLFEATGGDVSDLFEAPGESEHPPPSVLGDHGREDLDEDPIARLLRRGDDAFEAQVFTTAIHSWSRVLLLDPDHREARDRIAGARVSLGAQQRRVEELLRAAREAADASDHDGAIHLVTEALELDPTAAAAGALRDRLRPAAPTPPAATAEPASEPSVPDVPSVPELEDDLFREEGLGDLPVEGLGGTRLGDGVAELPSLPDLPPERWRLRLPMRTLAIAAAGLVVVLVGAWLGLRMFSGGDGSDADATLVNDAIAQAKTLADEGQVEAAVELLRGLEADDLFRDRIEKQIERYEAQLAPPTPTPIPEAIGIAEQLVLEDRFLDAYATVTSALERHPRDGGLVALRDDIVSVEPRLTSLHTALVDNRYEAAVGLALEMEELHPEWPDVSTAVNRSLFNAALAQMRTYNLTAAESYLRQLEARTPDDPEVDRVLEFVERYKARSVDMQLRIFIRSLKER
jgi:tetratricopeptide (TPR) repeat protein